MQDYSIENVLKSCIPILLKKYFVSFIVAHMIKGLNIHIQLPFFSISKYSFCLKTQDKIGSWILLWYLNLHPISWIDPKPSYFKPL
jgi:hypothetical protein